MVEHLLHYTGCKFLIFIFNGIYHFLVQIKYSRHHGWIRKKLAGKIKIAVFERIEQQGVDVVSGAQCDEVVEIKIQFADRFNILPVDRIFFPEQSVKTIQLIAAAVKGCQACRLNFK